MNSIVSCSKEEVKNFISELYKNVAISNAVFKVIEDLEKDKDFNVHLTLTYSKSKHEHNTENLKLAHTMSRRILSFPGNRDILKTNLELTKKPSTYYSILYNVDKHRACRVIYIEVARF